MKYLGVFLVMVLANVSMAQDKAVSAMAGAGDTAQQMKCSMEKQCMMKGMMPMECREQMGEKNCWGGPLQNSMRNCRLGRHIAKACAGMLFLCLLAFLTVNILLTVLVSLDMKKRKCFNGLWIPLLLICAVPVTVIYALFRIGDNLKGSDKV